MGRAEVGFTLTLDELSLLHNISNDVIEIFDVHMAPRRLPMTLVVHTSHSVLTGCQSYSHICMIMR